MRRKELKDEQRQEVEKLVKTLLHASRDWQRNHNEDTTKYLHNVNSPYYAEAFGIMRGIAICGFLNAEAVRAWFETLAREVIAEENHGGTNECDFCLLHYGKDAIRSRR